MWPWEHVLFGYLCYSLFCHAYYQEPPAGLASLLVVVASVLPDVIDKPLFWQFDVVTSGYTLGHSLLFAVPLAILAGVLAWSQGQGPSGLAFGIGYMLHLVGDVLKSYIDHGTLTAEHILWPIIVADTTEHAGFVDGVRHNLSMYVSQLGDPGTYVSLQVSVGAVAVLLWIYDGTPGPGVIRSWIGTRIVTP